MDKNIKAWREKVTEKAAIKFADMEEPCSLRGMFYCSQVGWQEDKVRKLCELLLITGESMTTIEEICSSYRTWCVANENEDD